MTPHNLPKAYPIDQFPMEIRNAISEVLIHVKAPDAVVAMSALSAISVACQGHVDVKLPTGQVRPVSLNTLLIADSGERKSTVDRLLAKPIFDHDDNLLHEHKRNLAQFESEMFVWNTTQKGLRRKLTANAANGDAPDNILLEVKEHSESAPVKPRLRRLYKSDLSVRALMDSLQGEGESLALMSDEGEIILGSDLIQQSGLMNKSWDGATLVYDRAYETSLIAHNPRLTVNIMVQGDVLTKHLRKGSNIMRGSGLLARYLIAWPQSTIGTRFTAAMNPTWTYLHMFQERIRELLTSSCRNGGAGDRHVLELDDDATDRWIYFANELEAKMKPGEYLHDIADVASKAMENTSRIAASFHYYTQQQGKISVDTLERAHRIASYHVAESKRLLSTEYAIPEEIVNSKKLERYLHKKFLEHGMIQFQRNYIYRCGPIRHKGQFDAAIYQLLHDRKIFMESGRNKMSLVNLNCQYFGSLPPY